MTTGSVNMYRRTCRRVGLDRNPMRRREDRVQTWVAAGLLLLFVLLVPLLVLTVGATVYRTETAAVQAEIAELHRVEAVVTATGKAPLYAPIMPAKVAWTDADGIAHTEDYQSTTVVEPGQNVTIWLNGAGRIVEPPSETQALSKAVLLTGGALFGAVTVLAGCYFGLRHRLDRKRLRMWEMEWATADLRWGSHS
ncbi:Rv1733c family protein [Nocardia brasiliensis]